MQCDPGYKIAVNESARVVSAFNKSGEQGL
jgi:hypothetical protein